MTKKRTLIGAHVSISGGFDRAILRGEKIGANCIQIFTKSNRQWKSKKISDEDIAKFIAQQKNSNIKIVAAHASYLINLGSSTSSVVEKSINALIDELQRCDILKIPFLILHPGTMHDKDEEQSLLFIAKNINTVLKKAKPQHVTLLLETMAGQGSTVGNKFEQLGFIFSHITQKKHVGVCVDTCHIFASGYVFDTPATYKKLWHDFDETIGLKKLKMFHINDSKKDAGSRVDRHEHIGEGMIKPAAFKLLMQDTKFKKIPKILETPKSADEVSDDIKNIKILQRYSEK
ncbi:deoxyribonuclease IV [Candidatus Babeliales bacterium]|nr:deoxyribonuclease IV [Candidatus Babeliales bacterium]